MTNNSNYAWPGHKMPRLINSKMTEHEARGVKETKKAKSRISLDARQNEVLVLSQLKYTEEVVHGFARALSLIIITRITVLTQSIIGHSDKRAFFIHEKTDLISCPYISLRLCPDHETQFQVAKRYE